VRRSLTAAGYLAAVGAGTAASVQLWLHAFSGQESLTARELAVPGASQRDVPTVVVPPARARQPLVREGSLLPANPLAPASFLLPSPAPEFPPAGGGSPSSPTPSTEPDAQPSTPVPPTSGGLAPTAQSAPAGAPTPPRSTQTTSSASQPAGKSKRLSKRRAHGHRAAKRRAVPAVPAASTRPAPSVPATPASPAVPPSGAKGEKHGSAKPDAKPDKHGKPAKPTASAPPSAQSGGGSAPAPGASPGDGHGNGAGHGKGHGK
jgi:hypothetical protein